VEKDAVLNEHKHEHTINKEIQPHASASTIVW